jgi:hypothetical protein
MTTPQTSERRADAPTKKKTQPVGDWPFDGEDDDDTAHIPWTRGMHIPIPPKKRHDVTRGEFDKLRLEVQRLREALDRYTGDAEKK